MDTLIRLAPVLGCLAMGIMMWIMMRGRHAPTRHTADPTTQEELNRLRAEVALLKQERATVAADADQPRTQP